MTLGILAAMHEEITGLLAEMGPHAEKRHIGMRDYTFGRLWGQDVVIVLSRMGKVAAAATTTTLIREFGVNALVFSGVAGGIGKNVKVGDVVVADQLIQHDMDARPLFPRHEIPLLGRASFPTDRALQQQLIRATEQFLQEDFTHLVTPDSRQTFGLQCPQLHIGQIASGDRFVGEQAMVADLRTQLPHALCVEMEGAAVAQVCYEYGIHCAVLRTVSDRADEAAHVDFGAFLNSVASHYSFGILRRFLLNR